MYSGSKRYKAAGHAPYRGGGYRNARLWKPAPTEDSMYFTKNMGTRSTVHERRQITLEPKSHVFAFPSTSPTKYLLETLPVPGSDVGAIGNRYREVRLVKATLVANFHGQNENNRSSEYYTRQIRARWQRRCRL